MRIHNHSTRDHSGFSLIEAMIAVLVLAVGLLALVALQANLVRESADAKARSRIAALVSSRIDAARAGGYLSIAPKAAESCSAGNEICLAQNDAAVAGLSVSHGVVTTPTPPAVGANDSQYKTLTVTASWTDSAARARSLSMNTIISPLSLDTSGTLLNQQLAGDVAKTPVVRTSDPATAGVIPIALGNGSSSAASNPTPELVGRNNNEEIVGTRFNVLTYVPSGGSAVIQKRIETAAIKCSCTFGAGGSNLPLIYRNSEWPAIWTGESYEVFAPENSANAPGQSLASGPTPGVEQSPLCQECCRDHHDTAASGVAKFDPERDPTDVRSSGLSKYKLTDAGLVPAVSGGQYVNACRIIRVDGLWRTAADMYSRQLGLLETESVGGVAAKTGLPTDAATTAYTTFVKDYLEEYNGTTGSAPAGAQEAFDATAGLNDPAVVEIQSPSTTDYRYLHARGLYVDYLEEAAREKISSVLADTGERGQCPTGSDRADCVMPYLPFTSANLTEIGEWVSSLSSVLEVNSGNLLSINPSEPSGGRSYGKSAGTADNTVSARYSNSGLALNTVLADLGGVDPVDDTDVATDNQAFEVGGTVGTPTGEEFFVSISGGGTNPYVFYVLSGDTGECVRRSNGIRPCTTNSDLPLSGSIRLEHYWRETTTKNMTLSGTCDAGGVEPVAIKGKTDVPTFTNYAVTAATVGGVAGDIGAVVDNGKVTETVEISFASIGEGAQVALTLAQEGDLQYAIPTTCTVGNGGNTTITGWTKPWEQP